MFNEVHGISRERTQNDRERIGHVLGVIRPSRGAWAVVVALLVLSCGVGEVKACNIPVFRYALERWLPDNCEVVILYDQQLTEAQQKQVAQMRRLGKKQGGPANANVILAPLGGSTDKRGLQDASNHDARWAQILDQDKDAQLPHVMIRTKLGKGRWINHWHGALDAEVPVQIWDSPVRSELRRRLLSGHAIVWIMLAGDEEAKNRAVRDELTGQFQTLASRIELPEGIGLPGSELYADVPLTLKFSLLEIDPKDEREQFLIRLFSGLQPQAFERREPLLIPVFGRGRALEVIPAGDLSESLVENLTRFLSAACSCQVKEQNPGFDLLIQSDWEAELFGEDGIRPPDRSAQEGRNRPPIVLSVPPGRSKSNDSSNAAR